MLNGKSGLFPSNYVIRIHDDKNKLNQPIKEKSSHDSNTLIKHEALKKTSSIKARVLYDYKAVENDELTLMKNDIVKILDKNLEDDGWWKVNILLL